MNDYQYDVVLSYASEDKELVSKVNELLKEKNLHVFFAPEQQSETIGLPLERALYKIYEEKARYVAVFVSYHYVIKKATMHEANTANSRVRCDDFCIIPIYIDGTKLPNLDESIAYFESDDVYEITSFITDIIKSRTSKQYEVDDGSKRHQASNEACLSPGNVSAKINGGAVGNFIGIQQGTTINNYFTESTSNEKTASKRSSLDHTDKVIKCITFEWAFPPSIHYQERSYESFMLCQELKEHDFIVLHGIGGVGKTELCRYLFNRWKNFDNLKKDGLFWIRYIGWLSFTANLEATCKDKFDFTLTEFPDSKSLNMVRKLTNKYGGRLILFIDNVPNVNKIENELSDFGCKIILTTRSSNSQYFRSIEIGKLAEENCIELYRGWSGDNLLETKDSIKSIIKLSDYHVLTIELIAKTQKSSYKNTQQMLRNLLNLKFDISDLKGKVQYSHNPELHKKQSIESRILDDQLLKVFKISDITRQELVILSILSVLSDEPIFINDLLQWINQNSQENINNLVEKGWLIKNQNSIVIHSIISSVIRYRYLPRYSSCHHFIENFIIHFNDFLLGKQNDTNYLSHAISISNFVHGEDIIYAEFSCIMSKIYNSLSDETESNKWASLAYSILEVLFRNIIQNFKKPQQKKFKIMNKDQIIDIDFYKKMRKLYQFLSNIGSENYVVNNEIILSNTDKQYRINVLNAIIGDSLIPKETLSIVIEMYELSLIDQYNTTEITKVIDSLNKQLINNFKLNSINAIEQNIEINLIHNLDSDYIEKILKITDDIINKKNILNVNEEVLKNKSDRKGVEVNKNLIHSLSIIKLTENIKNVIACISNNEFKQADKILEKIISKLDQSKYDKTILKDDVDILILMLQRIRTENSYHLGTKIYIKQLIQQLNLLKNIPESKNLIRETLVDLIDAYRAVNDSNKSIYYYLQLIDFDKESNDDNLLANDYYTLATYYEDIGEDGNAIEFYEQARELYRHISKSKNKYILSNQSIARINSRNGSLDIARTQYKNADKGWIGDKLTK